MFNLNFLMPLHGTSTKIFEWDEEEKWSVKKSYSAGKYFKGFECKIKNLEDAYEILETNQNFNCFMITGAIIEGTDKTNMVRRKRERSDGLKPTISDRNLSLFCLDIDGVDMNGLKNEEAIEAYIKEYLPQEFSLSDYIYQYSSSYRLTTGDLKCHLFFWLDEPVFNTDLKDWAKASKIPGLDPSVFNAAQPIYIQRRICERAEDPIDNFIGLVKKEGALKWAPGPINTNQLKRSQAKYDFDLTESIKKVLTAEDYHHSLNGIALSLINKKVPPHVVKSMLEGAMNASSVKDDRWQERFDDIGRAVDSAAEIVNNPTVDELLFWIEETDAKTVEVQFGPRCVRLDPVERVTVANAISAKTGFGIRPIQGVMKIAREQFALEQAQRAREEKTKEREGKGINEFEFRIDNAHIVCDKACKILAESKKAPRVFVMGGNLASVIIGKPKTIQQCAKLDNMGVDYPKMPIIAPYKKPYSKLAYRLKKDVALINENGKDVEPSMHFLNVMGDGESPFFKPLTGVVEHPFLDNNWNLIQESGYNERTGLFTILHHKLKIKKMDPIEAYKYIVDEVFDEFPFKSDLDQAVAVAALCTAIQRPTIAGDTGMPGFGIVSPTQSSGKTTLAQLISYSVYNRPVASTVLDRR
jgi:hypothetical protein